MISLQSSKEILSEESFSKKRKWDDLPQDQMIFDKPEKLIRSTKPPLLSDQLHNQTHFSSEWQRCLDIKSGQVYFYNTRTNKKALSDPIKSSTIEPHSNYPAAAPMSLELELNLPSSTDQISDSYKKHSFTNSTSTNIVKGGLINRSPSWLTFEEEQQEMITAVCKKCYMLVMMCKSSPACPNCKFVHPLDPTTTTSNLFKQELS